MPRYAAFLRAINIGGRRVKGAELCAPFEELGHTEVVSFRASGNVIFDAEERSVAGLTKKIESQLERSLGYEVAAMLRTRSQVRAIAAKEPFDPGLVEASDGKLQINLLARKPTAATQKKVLAMATEQDRLAIAGTELYWLPSGGLMDSELDQKALDALIGVSTRRTMGTIQQIGAKYFS
jgi:uncharacterized protein (DUF1697 family)